MWTSCGKCQYVCMFMYVRDQVDNSGVGRNDVYIIEKQCTLLALVIQTGANLFFNGV